MRRSTPLLALLLFAGLRVFAGASGDSGPAYFRTGVLTPDDRIWAQTQIERVYYQHRIWPKENPGPKPSFAAMIPAALIADHAAAGPLNSAALEKYWNIT